MMNDETKQRIADSVLAWCNDCRLYAAQVVIWNAELNEVEHLVEIAEGYFPADITGDETSNKIKSLLSQLDHRQMRAIRAYISLTLESPCKTEQCQESCNDN